MTTTDFTEQYAARILDNLFPCIAAKAAAARGRIRTIVAEHMACPADDERIVRFLYEFVDDFRTSPEEFQSAMVIFKGPDIGSEKMFDDLLWRRLQCLADIDQKQYAYDPRVSPDPSSAEFSFSIKEEAFYVIGLHPASSRKARAFPQPGLVFNPHQQFVRLRENGKFSPMRQAVRKRDTRYSGSVNPMLADFGEISEAHQYSGRNYDKDWKCPLAKRDTRHGGS